MSILIEPDSRHRQDRPTFPRRAGPPSRPRWCASAPLFAIVVASGCFDPSKLDTTPEQDAGSSTDSTGDDPEASTTVDGSTPSEGHCGDGIVDDGELCDGVDLDGRVCQSLGFGGGTLRCADDCTFDVAQCGGCGNGVVDGDEACDGVAFAEGDSCADVGLGLESEPLACTQWCTLDFSACSSCGDGVVTSPELCESGEVGEETCASQGFDGGTLTCGEGCSFDFGGCQLCGNGILEGTELCDGNQATQDCTDLGYDGGTISCADDCTYDVSACEECGDGMLGASEACDGAELGDATCVSQGFTSGSLGCTAACTFDVGACVGQGCGDEVINGAEECDGADLDGASCASRGYGGGTLSCTAMCAFDESACYACGDGTVDPGEACDGSAAGHTCLVETGLPNGSITCSASCTLDTSDCSGTPSRTVFITAGQYSANFGGALGADDICQDAADDAGLGGTFRAWVSDSATTPLDRFDHEGGAYQLLNGTVIANDWDDLVDGNIAAAIGITELGSAINPATTTVATATDANGDRQEFNGDCLDWSTNSMNQTAGIGNEENTVSWSSSGAVFCNTPMSLYCFEQ